MPALRHASVRIPASLLSHPALTASAKVVWMALQLLWREQEREAQQRGETAGPSTRFPATRLARLAGVSRPVVYQALRILEREGLFPGDGAGSGSSAAAGRRETCVSLPAALVADRRIDPQAKVVFGLLKLYRRELRQTGGLSQDPSRRGAGEVEPAGVESSASLEFTYSQLAQVTGLDRRTVAKAIRSLSAAGWLTVTRGSHRRPVRCQLKDPRLAGSETELQKAKRRLQKATFAGEAIMREFLTLLVDSEEYEDDAAPGFLVNPLTGERLQLDRYYPPSVAFEFNGPQHYGPTELYSAEEAEKQRARDLIKMGLCAQRGIHLVIVHAEDLSLSGMKQKIGNLLPIRDLTDEGPRISYLQAVARRYRRRALRGAFPAAKEPGK